MNNFSMKPRILPFLEQNAVFNSLNMCYAQETAQNATNLTTQINTFLCPSDGNNPSATYAVSGAGTLPIAYTSYPDNLGTIHTNNGGQYDGPAYYLGVATYGPTVTLASITDGTSNTAMLERDRPGEGRDHDSRPEPGLPHDHPPADGEHLRTPRHLPERVQERRRSSPGLITKGGSGAPITRPRGAATRTS